MTEEPPETVTDWGYIDRIESKLDSMGVRNIRTNRIGTQDVVTDFQEPGRTPNTEQRGIGSSLRIRNPREFKKLTHRLPTWQPGDKDVGYAFSVAREMANSVMSVRNRNRVAPDQVRYVGRIPPLGTVGTIMFEPRSAVADSINIHAVIDRGNFPPGEAPDPLTILDLVAELTDAFYDAI